MSSESTIRRDLDELLRSAQTRWPDVKVAPERFLAHLLERAGVAERSRAELHTDDLYLACACLAGDERAIARLRTHCVEALGAVYTRLGLAADKADEARQALWMLLLTPREPGARPALAGYGGQGRLAGWVAVLAVRTAIKQLSRHGREVPVSGDLLDELFAGNADPELEYVKQRHRAEFKEAFREAFRRLSPRQRNVLRQHFLDGVAINQLATLYRVHRGTVWRWICTAQEEIADHTRLALMRRTGASAVECESILRIIESRMELTMRTAADE